MALIATPRGWVFASDAEAKSMSPKEGEPTCRTFTISIEDANQPPKLGGVPVRQLHICYCIAGEPNETAAAFMRGIARVRGRTMRGMVLLLASTAEPVEGNNSININTLAFRGVRATHDRPMRAVLADGRLVRAEHILNFAKEWAAESSKTFLHYLDNTAYQLRRAPPTTSRTLSSLAAEIDDDDGKYTFLTTDGALATRLHAMGIANVHAVTPTLSKFDHLCFGCGHVRAENQGRTCVCRTVGECGRPGCVGLRDHRCPGAPANASRTINVGNFEWPQERQPSCAACGKKPPPNTALKRCGRCRDAMYCGPACQRAAWAEHKGSCKKPTN